jgi:hypothetical protein
MDIRPSVMDLTLYSLDGPFEEATCLTHVEILMKNGSSDRWFKLPRAKAHMVRPRLHMQIFLTYNKENNLMKKTYNFNRALYKKVQTMIPICVVLGYQLKMPV